VGRYLPTPQSLGKEERVVSVDRVRSLFDPRHSIYGTDFASRFSKKETREFVRLLKEALIEKSILPRMNDLELRGYGGISKSEHLVESHRFDFEVAPGKKLRLPATWLSQGYQGTICWIADIIGQVLREAKTRVDLKDMEGIVLIDEIDLHLHPKWQKTIIGALREAFPKIQFIATTHSPMVLPGLRAEEIMMLGADSDGSVVVRAATDSPERMTGTEIYEAFYDLPPRDRAVENALDEYGRLSLDPDRTNEDETRLQAASRKLIEAGIHPGWQPVPRISRPQVSST
jgi:hypothetical protein